MSAPKPDFLEESPAELKSTKFPNAAVKRRNLIAGSGKKTLGILVDGLLKSLSWKLGERSLLSQQVRASKTEV